MYTLYSSRHLFNTNIDVRHVDALNEKTEKNGALIGGVAGAGVVLTMIIIIVVVFLLRRSKQKQNKNSNSPSHVNHDNLLKAKIHANPSYHDVNGEVLNTVTHESVQMQHMEKESITYATITKVPGSSDIARDNFNCITTNEEQSMTDVYSMVHKRPNTGQNLHPMNQNEVGDEKYDKINFDKSYQPKHAELAGDVYDKTNFCCEDRGDISENVYNKAEFYHKHQSVDDWNIYDKPNFDGGQQNKQNENLHTNQKGASPGQRSKDFYAKAYFHRMPQDKCSDDEYDRIKLQL
ncbi:hypothetical protein CHS0354_000962 [Potamilus streckersoni]|uniref:Uncharacterized protein n=1 Tax=Potamilus streckersoni TaxID=2493646 RepID=A0AAE0TIF5_9BIVA|nr:hypothetical protein CHS0354_000962 [Potamilus streckersoni]